MAAAADNLDGEARLVNAMTPPAARILDSGCGPPLGPRARHLSNRRWQCLYRDIQPGIEDRNLRGDTAFRKEHHGLQDLGLRLHRNPHLRRHREGFGEGTVGLFNERADNLATGLSRNHQVTLAAKRTLKIHANLDLVASGENPNDIFGTYHC